MTLPTHQSNTSSTVRQAKREDASLLARLVNYAGEGMPLYLWGQMAEPDETAWEVGARRAGRDEGGFSWRNSFMLEDARGMPSPA
ncbi:MAG: hypothetical protein AAGJ70_06860 [Pseudomonadota bacterium]